ncbi:ABC transporter permease subunit [Streptacidiphilus sp. PB12-B1b]|uniref:ABC transporter permease n=1 Tax=Streptacidiphilus sp. PB12-B1b TaxID=2705012 RepID=UPI0015FBFAF8|nr:ABC transporter permease [Streptacidiphilus sp. PB12-B1b]QMU78724.1 ABC transporter permease subunit [Streptacidiphilus sp. PB12-B1b]
MNALAYERRRLTGVRSTWAIILAALALDAAVAAMTVREHALAEPVRVLTAGVPLLPLPLAALAAGALGALSYGQEVRYPALRPLLTRPRRRLALLAAKLTVTGVVSALLALATLAVDGVVLHVSGRAWAFEHELLHGRFPAALGGFAALVVAGGWIGLLAAGLLRSAAAGLLALVVLPVFVEPALSLLRHRAGLTGWGRRGRALGLPRLGRLFPVDQRHAWFYGPVSGLHGALPLSPVELAVLILAPVLLLLAGYALLISRRREV